MCLFFGKTLKFFFSNFLFWRPNTLSLLKLVWVAVYKLLKCVRYLWKKYEWTKNKNFWNLVRQNEHKQLYTIYWNFPNLFYLLSQYPCCILLFVETVCWMIITFEFLLLLFKNLLDGETRVLFSISMLYFTFCENCLLNVNTFEFLLLFHKISLDRETRVLFCLKLSRMEKDFFTVFIC